MNTPVSPIEARIGALRQAQHLITQVRDFLRDCPGPYRVDVVAELSAVAAEFSDAESVANNGQVIDRERHARTGKKRVDTTAADGPDSGNVRQRMRQFFVDSGNLPAKLVEIAAAVGAKKVAVGTILYKGTTESLSRKGRWRRGLPHQRCGDCRRSG